MYKRCDKCWSFLWNKDLKIPRSVAQFCFKLIEHLFCLIQNTKHFQTTWMNCRLTCRYFWFQIYTSLQFLLNHRYIICQLKSKRANHFFLLSIGNWIVFYWNWYTRRLLEQISDGTASDWKRRDGDKNYWFWFSHIKKLPTWWYQQQKMKFIGRMVKRDKQFGKRFYWTAFNIGYMENRHTYWDNLAQCGRIYDNDTHTNE